MKTIRGGRGLGDALYVQGVVRHLVRLGQRLAVRSDWPDVFRPHGDRVEIIQFSRKADITAHYTMRKGVAGTTQFEDCCISAGIREPVELKLDWTPTNPRLIESLGQKPILVVQVPRLPMGRTDGFGAELLPRCEVIQYVIDKAKQSHRIVQVGAGEALFKFTDIDLDLVNETSVAELLDVASVADRFLGYCSYLVPLAESFGKPALFVWSRRGLNARHLYVRQITPQKVLRASSSFVVDDCTDSEIGDASDAFLRK